MCPSTNNAEGKVTSENTPLHISPSLSNPNLRKSKSGEVSSRSNFSNALETNGDEMKSDPVLVSLSLTQAAVQGVKQKNVLSGLDDGNNQFDDPNSSFLAETFNAFSDALSENGSISEGKDTDSQFGVKSSNFCAEMIMLPDSVCQGTTDFAEQMDIFMRCQHPLDILSMFQEDKGGADVNNSFADVDGGAEVHRVSGYHAIPRACEYCGSQNIDLCRDDPDCERPPSYFPRERPPFYSKEVWKWKKEAWKWKKQIGISSKGEENGVVSKFEGSAEQNVTPAMACSAWV